MSIDDRGESQQPVRRSLSRGQTWAGLLIGLAVLGGLTWRNTGEKQEERAPEFYAAVPLPEMRPEPVVQRVLAQIAPQQMTAQPAPPIMAPDLPAAKGSRMVSFAVTQPQASQTATPANAPTRQESEARQETSVAFRGQVLPGKVAGAAMDTSLVLMPGVYSCILDTAVNSERAGPFQCHTDEDIRSPLGVPLMDAGTVIIGSYQSDVRQGQSRVPGIAVTGYTPQGVPVPLGALVSDELGRVGMPGRVNRHLMERFGGAFMLLLSQGAIDLARSALMSGNGNSQVNLNTGSVQSLASETLRGTINIPNTVEKNQGERVSFFVTEPVSFEGTYRLRTR